MDKLEQPLRFFLEKHGLQEQLKKRIYFQIWPDVVGEKITRYTQPVKIERDRLIVEVNDSTWLYHLTMLKSKIIDDFNAKAGTTVIQDIKFINADFRAQRREEIKNRLREKSDHSTALNHQIKGIQLEKEEIEEIEEAVDAVPDFLRASLHKLYKNHYLRQAYHRKQGAKQCSRCRGLSLKLEDQLCLYCQKDLDAWTVVLDNFFKQTPWGTYDLLKREHPFLDEQLFKIYKNKMVLRQIRHLTAALAQKRSGDDGQEKKLKEIAQSYVLLVSEKEPTAIQKEHIYAALNRFPGLYELLYA